MLLHQQGTAEYTHDLIDVSLKFHLVLDNSNETVCSDRNIYLYPDCCFRVSPESCHPQVLFYPFEKQLDLPTIFIEKDNLFCSQIKIVGIECECPVELRNECHDASYGCRVIAGVPFSSKPYSLVPYYIGAVIQEIFSRLHNIFRTVLLPYDEERFDLLNMVKPVQVPITTIKYVAGKWLIFYHIKRIHIMSGGLCYVDHRGDLGNNIKLGMEFDAGFGAPESCPAVNAHAEVYGGGIKCIELSIDTEFPIDTASLGHVDHMISELLEDMPISVAVASGKDIAVNRILSKAEVKGLLGVGCCDVCQLSEAPAPKQLTKHENQKLSPIGQLPLHCAILDFILCSLLHDPLKISLWQKVGNLTENISSCMHQNSYMGNRPNIIISKVRQDFQYLKFA